MVTNDETEEDFESLLSRVQAQPEDQRALLDLADLFLAETTTQAQRRQIRAALNTPAHKLACENLYFDGVGMETPEPFVQHILALLFMSSGFGDRETARRILSELHVFAGHHGLDFEAHYSAIRDLPGARRGQGSRRRYLLLNAGLLLVLLIGVVLIQRVPSGWQIPLQIALFIALLGAQLALLYRSLA